jgi:hypothetical protein
MVPDYPQDVLEAAGELDGAGAWDPTGYPRNSILTRRRVAHGREQLCAYHAMTVSPQEIPM